MHDESMIRDHRRMIGILDSKYYWLLLGHKMIHHQNQLPHWPSFGLWPCLFVCVRVCVCMSLFFGVLLFLFSCRCIFFISRGVVGFGFDICCAAHKRREREKIPCVFGGSCTFLFTTLIPISKRSSQRKTPEEN